jgi:threonine aldolase
MADRVSAKLTAIGLAPVWPVEANLVFVVLPRALDARLKAAGALYYGRTSTSLNLGPDQILARLVTSFATQEDEIDRFAHLCKAHSLIL